MATKAQLEAELTELKAKLSRTEEPAEPEVSTDADNHRASFDKMLSGYGVDSSDLDALWTQFSKELGDFPTQKPLMTAIAAFGLGFALGRITKF